MKKLIIILCLFIIFASGCTAKDQKYVSEHKQDRYVQFNNDQGHTAFYHSGSTENYKGTWTETETDYTMFLDTDGSSLVFKKLEANKIGLVLDKEGNLESYTKG